MLGSQSRDGEHLGTFKVRGRPEVLLLEGFAASVLGYGLPLGTFLSHLLDYADRVEMTRVGFTRHISVPGKGVRKSLTPLSTEWLAVWGRIEPAV